MNANLIFGQFWIISLHICSMWETTCDAQAGLCTHSSNSKICVQILQKAPFWNFRPESPLPPKWKTSDLRWPKFTLEYPPHMRNFRFEITKVYSRIPPPPPMKNFRFEMTEVYSGIPPPAWNLGDRMWRLICIPRGYHSFKCCPWMSGIKSYAYNITF